MAFARPVSLVSLSIAIAIIAAMLPATAAHATLASQPLREPQRHAPLLQITEVAANTSNVNGVDAFEFVEVVNASSAPQAWADFRLRYVYPLVDFTTVAHAVWPVQGGSPVLDPGDALVLWVVSDATAHLTVADFNAAHGVQLTEGRDVVRVRGAGLANGSLRGVEVATASGISVSRAYYNVDGAPDAVKGAAVQYGPSAAADDIQPRLRVEAASPGAVETPQMPAAPLEDGGPGDAPTVLTDPRSTFTPGRSLALEAWARDDGLIRSVTLHLSTDLDPEPVVHALEVDEVGLYTYELTAADTVGRSSVTYQFVVSDGYDETASEPITLTGAASPRQARLRAIDSWDVATRARVESSAIGSPAVRAESGDGDIVAGDVRLIGAGSTTTAPTLAVDGVALDTEPALEHEPIFAFDATLTDAYFRNGVVLGDEVLTVFDRGYYSERHTVETMVPLEEVRPGEPFTLRVYSGTKARTAVDPDEGNDDFTIQNLRLVLPDGTTLRPSEHPDPAAALDVGDGRGSEDWIEATFTVPEEHFTARAALWDSTTAADGAHEVTATVDGERASAVLTVDNTAPTLDPTVRPGTQVRGERALDVRATDEGAGVEGVTATLDGRAVTLPLTVSSLVDEPGQHVATVRAVDARGNVSTLDMPYSIPHEAPGVTLASSGAAVTVTDQTGDPLDVTIAPGRSLGREDLRVARGTVADADADLADREAPTLLDPAAWEDVAARDGDAVATTADDGLPYLVLEADVPPGTQPGAELRVRWDGRADQGARVSLSVLDPATGEWSLHDATVAGADDVALEALVPVDTFAADGGITALVQLGVGYAGRPLSDRANLAQPHHPEDTARGDYDFTVAWESDTQYYNAREDIHDRQVSMHDYLLDQRDELNLQYVIHTGDIVDWSASDEQWGRAEPSYRAFDEAGLPYGVLAGNHDVDQQTNDYTQFSRWFGAHRFEDNPWYGGDHLDNRGHYDLVRAGGIDLLFLYMGWGAGDEQIRWMNEVLAQYPERVAFVNLHEYMLTTGGLGITPQRIHDEVVATNPNVRFVLGGHYHDAFTRTDDFDDNGDGTADRTVTSMLFDYQDLPAGGEGYLRLLHFDNVTSTITVRTYSDYLRDYDAVHPSLADEHQEFTIPYERAGIEPAAALLETDALRLDLLQDEPLARFTDVAAGTTLTGPWTTQDSQGWFVRAVDPFGAAAISEVRTR